MESNGIMEAFRRGLQSKAEDAYVQVSKEAHDRLSEELIRHKTEWITSCVVTIMESVRCDRRSKELIIRIDD
jgi:hypothetical protein